MTVSLKEQIDGIRPEIDARLTFDEEQHVYMLDGSRLPNVTSIIGPLSDYSKIPPNVLAQAQERGTAVHKACELYLNDDLDEASLDEVVAPYFYQFLRFLNESKFKPWSTELRLFHQKIGYAGTLDLPGALGVRTALIDLKTPVVMNPATGVQVAAYEQAFRELLGLNKKKRIYRYGLKLQPDHYQLVPFENPNDFSVFLAMKTYFHWKENNL